MNISTLMIMMSLPVVKLAKKFIINSFKIEALRQGELRHTTMPLDAID
jgi:uncharacterized linocin/CFP29 family protein